MKNKRMKALITGAGGFIGQNVALYLQKEGIEVIGAYHNRAPEIKLNNSFSCDLFEEGVDSYLVNEKIDAIIHFAGQMKGKKFCEYLDNTIESTRKLIDYAEKNGIMQFIYISSISVYGETQGAVNETSDRINPDDYGMSKYLCERLIEDAEIKKRMVIRLPRTLGKGCDLSYPWLPKVTGQMMKNEDINYMNPDLMYNNMLYVDDLSGFLLRLLKNDFRGFERYVLAPEDRMSILDILKTLKRELNSESALTEKPAGRNKCYAIDAAHAREHGFKSRCIEEIISQFVRDMKEHECG